MLQYRYIGVFGRNLTRMSTGSVLEAFLIHLKPGYCLEIGYHCHPAVKRVSSRNFRDNLIQCCVALEVDEALISC